MLGRELNSCIGRLIGGRLGMLAMARLGMRSRAMAGQRCHAIQPPSRPATAAPCTERTRICSRPRLKPWLPNTSLSPRPRRTRRSGMSVASCGRRGVWMGGRVGGWEDSGGISAGHLPFRQTGLMLLNVPPTSHNPTYNHCNNTPALPHVLHTHLPTPILPQPQAQHPQPQHTPLQVRHRR